MSSKVLNLILFLLIGLSNSIISQSNNFKPSKVDFDSYENLVQEVKLHREKRLIPLDTFLKFSLDSNTIILDSRTKEKYEGRHIHGARHLNFTDFTEENLQRVLLNKDVRILIYCNNNIDGDEVFFPTKARRAVNKGDKEILLALNIPTYISLYGYGYRKVYELSELVHVKDKRVQFDGTSVRDDNLLDKLQQR